jgi:hypothetical protein
MFVMMFYMMIIILYASNGGCSSRNRERKARNRSAGIRGYDVVLLFLSINELMSALFVAKEIAFR